jgi:hypothetical protein
VTQKVLIRFEVTGDNYGFDFTRLELQSNDGRSANAAEFCSASEMRRHYGALIRSKWACYESLRHHSRFGSDDQI